MTTAPPPGAQSPSAVYVCICNAVTDHEIRQAATAGCGSMAELTMRTGAGSCCGTCIPEAADLLAATRAELELPLLEQAA